MPLTLLAATAGWLMLANPAAQADDDGRLDPPTVTATVTSLVTATSVAPPPRIECSWSFGDSSPDHAEALNVVTELVVEVFWSGQRREVAVTYYYDDGALRRWSETRKRFEALHIADCSQATHRNGVSTGDSRWFAVGAPDPRIVLQTAVDEATEPIGLPAPALSPPGATAVNLGLWLAVEPAGPIVARADLGPIWARTTATLTTTSFDPGNGDDAIVCAGHGTPIPDSELDSIDEGPCGYTYRADSDGEPLDMTITSTWSITWELSDGTAGSEPDIVVSTVEPYEVVEIQTVGTRG